MTEKEKIAFLWSGGKDSALALHKLLQDDSCEIVSLLTTCSEHSQRVSMHGVRVDLVERQAAMVGLPLEKMFVSPQSSENQYREYRRRLAMHLLALKARGVTSVGFGDIFLEDQRQWRENTLAGLGLKSKFPIWKRNSRDLVREFIALG